MTDVTLGSLFPGKMGRVELTRVAIKMRRPDLLKMKPTAALDGKTASDLEAAIAVVRKG